MPSTKQNSVVVDSVSKEIKEEIEFVGEENVLDEGDEK
jgi:hypothetical protein